MAIDNAQVSTGNNEQDQEKENVQVELYSSPKGEKEMRVRIGDLVSLEEIDDTAKIVVRSIDTDNFNSLVKADPKKVPPIEIQDSNVGKIILNGYHRYFAEIARIRIEYWKTHGRASEFEKEGFDEIAFLKTLSKDMKPEEKAFVNNKTMRAIPKSFTSLVECFVYAGEANTTNGLPPTSKSRAQIALWLMETLGITMNEAARRMKTSTANIVHYRDAKKRNPEAYEAKKQKRMNDAQPGSAPSEEKHAGNLPVSDVPTTEKQKNADKQEKTALKFAESMRAVFVDLSDNTYEDAANYLVQFFKNEDAPMIRDMQEILNFLTDSLDGQAEIDE